MRKFVASLLCCLFFLSSMAQQKAVEEIVDRFVDTLAAHSYMQQNMDLDQLRKETKLKIQDMTATDSLLPVLRQVVQGLKDHHSNVFQTDEKEDELALLKLIATTTYEQAGMPPRNFQHRMIEGKYAYINVPGVALEHKQTIDTLQKQIAHLDGQNPKAWIIDLTENDGGSYHPMIYPFHYLIDTVQTFSFANGKKDVHGNDVLVNPFKVPSNGLYIDNSLEARTIGIDSVQAKPIQHHDIPIIVLISNITGSSGEITAVHFKGQKNVRLVGNKTSGLTSSNSVFAIGGGYYLNLMTELLHDRTGKTYAIGEGVEPDIPVDIKMPADLKSFQQRLDYVKANKDVFLQKAITVLESLE